VRTTNDERGEKRKEEKGEDFLDLLTGKNFLATPLQKKSMYFFTKSFSPWTHCIEDFCHPDPYAPSNLEYVPQPLKYAKMRWR